MLEAIFHDFKEKEINVKPSSEILLLINGLGGTPLSELYLVYNSVAKIIKEKKIKIARSLVGNYTTALDMAGVSITICLLDNEIKANWDNPVLTSSLRWDK